MENNEYEINLEDEEVLDEVKKIASNYIEEKKITPPVYPKAPEYSGINSASAGSISGNSQINTEKTRRITNPVLTKSDNLSEVLFQILKYADDVNKLESIMDSIEWENTKICKNEVAEWFNEKLNDYLIEVNKKKEQDRIKKIREEALAKLSDEEKKALGIDSPEKWKDENKKPTVYREIKNAIYELKDELK